LFNLRVAAAAAGLHADVSLLPDTADPDVLAHVRLAPATATPGEAALHPAIAGRRTHRARFAATPVDAQA